MAAITYAKAGVTPPRWRELDIIDLDTGAELRDVVEVNTVEGWLIRHRRNEAGDFFLDGDPADPEVASERIDGRFELRLRA